MPRPAPVRHPRLVALVAVAVLFVGGCVAILLTGASAAHLGTVLVGCAALGTILATGLDRRTGPQARGRRQAAKR